MVETLWGRAYWEFFGSLGEFPLRELGDVYLSFLLSVAGPEVSEFALPCTLVMICYSWLKAMEPTFHGHKSLTLWDKIPLLLRNWSSLVIVTEKESWLMHLINESICWSLPSLASPGCTSLSRFHSIVFWPCAFQLCFSVFIISLMIEWFNSVIMKFISSIYQWF